MKGIRRLVAAAAMAAVPAAAPAALPEGAFGWMADLAGSCWTGTYADGTTRDTQCYSTQYDRFLRGTIEIVGSDGSRPPYLGDSVFVWDPATRRMKFYYWSSGGSDGVANGQFEGERIDFPNPPRADSDAPPTRTSWTRLTPDSYRVTLQRQVDGQWSDVMAVDYHRVAQAPAQ